MQSCQIVGSMVVAQLAEWTLLMPEVCGSNPYTGKFYGTFIYCQLYCVEKTKIREKQAGNGPFFIKKKSTKL